MIEDYMAALFARIAAHDAREREKRAAQEDARDKALADARAYVWNAAGECQPKE